MPGQRLCFFHIVRQIWRGRNHFSGRVRRTALRVAGNSGGDDFRRVRNWTASDSIGRGDARQELTGLNGGGEQRTKNKAPFGKRAFLCDCLKSGKGGWLSHPAGFRWCQLWRRAG